MKHIKKQKYFLIISVFAVLTLALLIRLWGINFGLPYIYHTDEWFEIKRALQLGAGIFNFERVTKGGYFYLLCIEYGIYFVLLKLFGIINSTNDFLLKFFQDPSGIWLIGRITTACIGTLNCYILYLLGKKTVSSFCGLLAATYLAFYTIHVASSHYVTVDVPLTTLVTLCFLIIVSIDRSPSGSVKNYILLGIVFAGAVMTKIPAALLLFPILACYFWDARKTTKHLRVLNLLTDKRLWLLTSSFLCVYVIGNPGIVIKFKDILIWSFSFLQPATAEVVRSPEFPQLYDQSGSIVQYYMSTLYPLRYLALAISCLVGFVLTLIKKERWSLYTSLFILPYLYFLFASKSPEHIYARYLLPIIPLLMLYSAYFFNSLLEKGVTVVSRIAIGVLILASLMPVVYDSVLFSNDLTKEDTRTIAKEWIEKTMPEGSVIYLEGGLISPSTMTVPLNMSGTIIDEVMREHIKKGEAEKNIFYSLKKEAISSSITYHLVLTSNTQQLKAALDNSIGDYVIFRDTTTIPFTLDINKKQFPVLYRLIKWVESEDFKLIRKFAANKKTTGPTILIYERQK